MCAVTADRHMLQKVRNLPPVLLQILLGQDVRVIPISTTSVFRLIMSTAKRAFLYACMTFAWHSAECFSSEPVLFQNVRVFDGEKGLGARDVLVAEGKIAKIGDKVASPENAKLIDGTGKTLLPGLIDSHVHVMASDDLATSALFGVTCGFDMGGQPQYARLFKREQITTRGTNRADILGAGFAVTIKGGHGTQFDFAVPTLDSAEAAQAFVDARIAEGSDYIKIAYGGGSRPVMTKKMLLASIDAAHARNKMAIAHIDTREQAMDAIECGIDGLAHLCGDALFNERDVAIAKRKGVFIIPTTTVMQGFTVANSTKSVINDPTFKDWLSPTQVQGLQSSFRVPKNIIDYEKLQKNTLAMHRAGVPILAGSDAPNPATTYGASLHHELELLVHAGLTEAEALAAATSKPAHHFGLVHCGRIKVGFRANLLFVEGNPLDDIKDTRRILGVWKDGHALDRQVALNRIVKEREERQQLLDSGTRLISDFDESIKSEFGAGWSSSTDGKSTGSIDVAEGGANGSRRSLRVSGNVRDGAGAYSGAWFAPGAIQAFPADLTAHKTLSFWVKGQRDTHAVMIFAQGLPRGRSSKRFTTTGTWTQVRFDLADFNGCDGRNVLGIWFGSHASGEFEFLLDEVALKK